MEHDGGPAFPMPSGPEPRVNDTTHYNVGMSLLDFFAGEALAGLLASGPHDCGPDGIAHDAYSHAAAMLAEKRRRDGATP